MRMKTSLKFLFCSGIILSLLGTAQPVLAAPTVIKVAVVTPEGSAWVHVLKQMVAQIETQTQGTVTFKIYPGGVSGDEADVLRKMRVNRLQAGGFSGVGLGFILPQIRILEAPLLFHNDQEIDYVREQMFDQFAAAFEQKGYVLLGFAEGGWVYLFSKEDLSADKRLKEAKMWVWEGDQVAETFLNSFGVRTTPLHIADVNTGLETGMIDAFYAPPMAAVAFQWHARIQYVLDYPLANSTAALLMNKRAFYALSDDQQHIVRTQARAHCRKLVEMTRRDNRKALQIMREKGIALVKPTAQQVAEFASDSRKTYARSIPDLYPQALFDRIQSILKAYRATAGQAARSTVDGGTKGSQ